VREVALRLLARLLGGAAGLRDAQPHTCAARLRETDRDGLRHRARAVLPCADVVDLFAHELASLRRR
jgi:hypothetical protein